jgi:hypothetical protein
MLAASWWVSRWCISHYWVDISIASRLLMGLVAFAFLMLAEVMLSVTFFGNSVSAYLQSFQSMPGIIGLAAQIAFAGIPFVQAELGYES